MNFTRTQILNRYRRVARVFSHHGLGFLAEALGLARLRLWGPTTPHTQGGRGERLRRAFEELGPAFVKLGQMLSTRTDLLPPDVTVALERLQDQVAPFPSEQVRQVLEEELGAPPEQLFRSFGPEPIAAASLGQVHQAILPDGRDVVVKIQRPNVTEIVALDLHVLQTLAATAARRSKTARSYDLPGIAREFAQMLRGELDFEQEGRNAERFRENFKGDPTVSFPAVHWDYTTRRVLTLERVEGLRVNDREGLRKAGIQPETVASNLAGAIFRMGLRDGFFHADPHPGNLFAGAGGRVIFVDMGMVGELTPAMRQNVVEYVLGVVGRDPDRVVQALLGMGLVGRPRSTAALRAEVERLQHQYGEVPLGQMEFGPALRDTMAMARRFEMVFPSAYTVLLKTLTTLEAVARQIDPEATLVGLAAPYADLVMQGRLKPDRILERVGRELYDTGRLLARIPRQLSRVLGLMEQGEWRVSLDHSGLEPGLQRLSTIANRLSIAILLASLIIGTALVSSESEQSFLQHYPIADVGFLLIGAVGLWLILSIMGSRRM